MRFVPIAQFTNDTRCHELISDLSCVEYAILTKFGVFGTPLVDDFGNSMTAIWVEMEDNHRTFWVEQGPEYNSEGELNCVIYVPSERTKKFRPSLKNYKMVLLNT